MDDGCKKNYPGLVADIEIMRLNVVFLQRALAKEDSECERIEEMGEMTEEHARVWAVIANEGYWRISEVLSAVIPEKKPIRGS